jgi:hypothetical protein
MTDESQTRYKKLCYLCRLKAYNGRYAQKDVVIITGSLVTAVN